MANLNVIFPNMHLVWNMSLLFQTQKDLSWKPESFPNYISSSEAYGRLGQELWSSL